MEDIKPLLIDSKLNKNNCSDNNQTTLNQIINCSSRSSNSSSNNNGENENVEKLAYNLVDGSDTSNSSLFLSIVRICFWDRKLQEIEQQEIKEVYNLY